MIEHPVRVVRSKAGDRGAALNARKMTEGSVQSAANGSLEQTNEPCLVLGGDQLPEGLASQASIAAQCLTGLRRVVFETPFRLRAPSHADVRRLRAIRDLTSCSVPVEWAIVEIGEFDLSQIVSFYPPHTIAGEDQLQRDWADQFRYGSFYWRRGFEFLTIRDARQANTTLLTLDSADYIEAFRRCIDVDTVPRSFSQPLSDLMAEGVIVVISKWLLVVPYRMKHWPVPFNSV